jgi:hypothetical protein
MTLVDVKYFLYNVKIWPVEQVRRASSRCEAFQQIIVKLVFVFPLAECRWLCVRYMYNEFLWRHYVTWLSFCVLFHDLKLIDCLVITINGRAEDLNILLLRISF